MHTISFEYATPQSLPKIVDLYNNLIDYMDQTVNYPKWTKGVYPNEEFLQKVMEKKELITALDEEGTLLASMVLNHEQASGYEKIPWQVTCEPEEILVVHTFAVSNALRGQGLGGKIMKALLEELEEHSKIRSVRLDTIGDNTPAANLYKRAGFIHYGMHRLDYPQTPVKEFELFEYPIQRTEVL